MQKLVLLLLLTAMSYGIEISEIITAKEAVTKKGEDGYTIHGITDTFSPNASKIYALVKYRDAKANMPIMVSFVAVDAISVPNYRIADVNIKAPLPEGVVRASLTRGKGPFPSGKYRVDVYADNQKVGSKAFSVGEASGSQSSVSLGSEQKRTIPAIGQILFASKVHIDDKGMSVPEGISDHFSPDQHNITMVATYSNAKAKDIFTIRWIAVNAGTMHHKIFFEEKLTAELPKGALQDEMANPDDWPTGDYRVEIYFGQKRLGGKDFRIQKPATQQTQSSTALSPQQSAGIQLTGKEQPFTLPIGHWVADTESGEQVMDILSGTEIRYNGKPFHCRIDDKNIVIIDGKKQILYPYEINGGQLVLHYANGSTRTFVKKERKNAPYDPLSAAENPEKPATPTEKTSPLEKLYCSNNADGNEWVQFKPNGVFYFGSLQERGTPYGSGKYRLKQNAIDITFDGERGVARIVKKSGDNRISAIQYDGVIYASGLCP